MRKKTESKKAKAVSQNVKKRYQDFSTLKTHLEALSFKTIKKMTIAVDKMTLQPMTFEALHKTIETHRKHIKSEDFKDVNRIKSHIAFRTKHNNFIYKTENDTVQLIDVK